VIAEHLLARFGELEPFDFGRSPATYDVLGALGDESDAHQPPQLVGREAMHKHDRFGAAFGTAAREQHDSAALMGLEDSTAGRRHGGGTGYHCTIFAVALLRAGGAEDDDDDYGWMGWGYGPGWRQHSGWGRDSGLGRGMGMMGRGGAMGMEASMAA
jgi:hypothetical protein